MAITKSTVDLLRAAWTQGVQEVLDRNIEIEMTALVKAESIDTVRALQGKIRAYQAMRTFPEYVSNFVEEPSNG